ncbi:uncharacterized protein LOC125653822 isoform X1 [Ostrea edulis]|uniref:uncharacterized protein LOC125653822 isoform X1 n=1 Tax=Ostrea edulis TaxID=37623 RepID=UPI0024AF1081|nr:uncharacterized protein LOC125653822 isoform X1 [Ostrea edulis]
MINPHQHFISLILNKSFPRNMIEKKLPVLCEYSVRHGYPLIFETLLIKYQKHKYDIIHSNECISIFFHLIPAMDFIDAAYFKFVNLSSFLKCNCARWKMFRFHKLMEDRKRSFRVLLKILLNFKMNCSSMDFCYDDEGYNPLHRAVIGGNYNAFELLINNGMSVNVKSKDRRDVLQLLIEHAPCIQDDFDVLNKISLNLSLSYTESVAHMRSTTYGDIGCFIARNTTLLMKRTPTQICNRTTSSLSIAHVVAAKGLLEILEVIKETFGETYYHCLNHQNISTALLLSVFGHSQLHFLNIEIPTYLKESIVALYLKITFDFKAFVYPRDSLFWKCKYRVRNFRNTRSLQSCAGKVEEENAILMSRVIKLSGFKSREEFRKYCEICNDNEINLDSGFDTILKELREYWENPKRYKYKYLLQHKKQELLFENWNCKIRRDRKRSTKCLEILSEMIHLKRHLHSYFSRISVNILLTAIIPLYDQEIMLPFQFLPYNEYLGKLSRHYVYMSMFISQKYPGFQLSKEYDYWDVFRRNGDKRNKKMVQIILNTPVSEIRKWKGTERSRRIMLHHFEHSYDDLPTDRPLLQYERLQKNDN